MLSLDDTAAWSSLRHAYGPASDTPGLLRQLSTLPRSQGEDEPWFSLWSSLAHQGDVYPASFAAVPHVIGALATAPSQADFVYFQFPAWVEICRNRSSTPIPDKLRADYFSSLAELPKLVAAASSHEWDSDFLLCALSAVAAAKGNWEAAEVIQELTPEVARSFMEWFFNQ